MNVLFIGNSYTHFNNMPDMLQQLAQGAGKDLTTAKVTSGGKSLEWHWYNPESLDAIDKGGRDYVVLQDFSAQGIELPEKLVEKVTDFSARIRAAGAQPVLYNTWTRQHIPEKQDAINAAYARAAEKNGCIIAPAGQAWTRLRRTAPEIDLYVEDRSHPSILGSYTVACVFYATLFKTAPAGLANRWRIEPGADIVIDKSIAAQLQQAAWDTLQEHG